ncbi:hypothetical protein [Bradyrhizobium sp. STM 3561]|uniref:hypothetical protein n=1 Tax=Bradyrhizobium sp. STM 3561 TaxID=578923 RepID=UPI003890B169
MVGEIISDSWATSIGIRIRRYKEPISAVKRRAFARALERHPIRCDVRASAFEVTENGDLWVDHSVEELRLHGGDIDPYRQRLVAIQIPTDGSFVEESLTPDEATHRRGVEVERATDIPDKENVKYCWVKFGDGLRRNGDATSYGFRYACSNSIKMTKWEAEEKARLKKDKKTEWEEEWIGLRVLFPTKCLRLSVKLPESLNGVEPYIRCLRPASFPDYEVNKWGDVKAGTSPPVVDIGTLDEERLQYKASTRTWRLEVERPMVGYVYEIRWKLPSDKPIRGIASETRRFQNLLLTHDPVADAKAAEEFDVLLGVLKRLFRLRNTREKWAVVIFAYDHTLGALRPALSYRSWSASKLPSNFAVTSGKGIAGAAFQQRRMIAWGQSWAGESLVKPVHHPYETDADDVEMACVVALPLYHPTYQDHRRPPPWATIGAVSFGSAAESRQIATLAEPDVEAAEDLRRELRSAVQVHALAILEALRVG